MLLERCSLLACSATSNGVPEATLLQLISPNESADDEWEESCGSVNLPETAVFFGLGRMTGLLGRGIISWLLLRLLRLLSLTVLLVLLLLLLVRI